MGGVGGDQASRVQKAIIIEIHFPLASDIRSRMQPNCEKLKLQVIRERKYFHQALQTTSKLYSANYKYH